MRGVGRILSNGYACIYAGSFVTSFLITGFIALALPLIIAAYLFGIF